MEPVNLTCHTDRTELVLDSVLDVSRARAAYDALNEALLRALPLDVEAAQVERIDTAGFQLLVAFHRSARNRGLALHWRSVSTALRSGAESLGLTEALELPA